MEESKKKRKVPSSSSSSPNDEEPVKKERKKRPRPNLYREDVYLGIDIGTSNMSFCELEFGKETTTIRRWQLTDILDGENTDEATYKKIHFAVRHFLGQFPPDWTKKNISEVVIETQPYKKSMFKPKMHLIMNVIYSHFMFIFESIQPGDKLRAVRLASPKIKYPALLTDLIPEEFLQAYFKRKKRPANKKSDYLARKERSVIIEACFSRGMTKLEEPGGKKKDDKADSFLMAFFGANKLSDEELVEILEMYLAKIKM